MSFGPNYLYGSLKRTRINAFTEPCMFSLYVLPVPLHIGCNFLYVSRYFCILIPFNAVRLHFDCRSLHGSISVIEELRIRVSVVSFCAPCLCFSYLYYDVYPHVSIVVIFVFLSVSVVVILRSVCLP